MPVEYFPDKLKMNVTRKLPPMTVRKQLELLDRAKQNCAAKMELARNASVPESSGGVRGCEMVWDNILCWDAAPPGTVQLQRCPDYVNAFNTSEYASKFCTSNGTWYQNSEVNTSSHWTNYTNCHLLEDNMQDHREHGERLTLIQTIGYGVSLCSLIVAVSIMLFSRLKSKSNILHINLFLAFILRASFSFVSNYVFVGHLGLSKDVGLKVDGSLKFNYEGIHWECRLLFSLFMYSICASQTWIFVEGLYLHMLIYKTLSTERNGVRPYVVLGWVLPLVIMVPVILVKAFLDSELCWQRSKNSNLIWIMHGPILATVLLNFAFFLNISRVLCSRVRSTQRHMSRSKYRHLAKFILVLIPLFGVFYIIVLVVFYDVYADKQDDYNLTHMYVENVYNSFQGFVLALLFCFLNEEVHGQVKRIWWRRRNWRRESAATRTLRRDSGGTRAWRRESGQTRTFPLSSMRRNSQLNETSPAPSLSVRPRVAHDLTVTCISRDGSVRSHHGRLSERWSSQLKTQFLRLFSCDQEKNIPVAMTSLASIRD